MIKTQYSLVSFALILFCSTIVAKEAMAAPLPQATNANVTLATTYADDIKAPTVPVLTADPYEGYNRVMFTFNEKVDKYVAKPVASAYNTIMPKPLNQGVHNFFNNIDTLPTLANDILQLNFYQAANDSWRLLINTTIGVGGLFDVASRIGLKYYSNDFGLTLATWGYSNSNYFVMPFFGPCTVRDGIGLPVDYYALSVYPYIYPESSRYQLFGLSALDKRTQLLKFQDVVDEASIDKYVFMRNAYMQRRAHKIEENQHLSYKERESDQPVAEVSSSVTETDNNATPAVTEITGSVT